MSNKLIFTASFIARAKQFLNARPELLPLYEKSLRILELQPDHPSLRFRQLQSTDFYSIVICAAPTVVMKFLHEDASIIPVDLAEELS